MSQYPYAYGHYYGTPPQYPFPQQPPAPYASPPVFGSLPDPRTAASHFAVSQNSFNHNASAIPGLGSVGTPNSINPYNPPGGSTWAQAQTPSYPAGAAGPVAQLTATTPPVPFQHESSQQHIPGQHDIPQGSDQESSTDEMRPADDEMEEGELGESQSEIYEPREPAMVSTSRRTSPGLIQKTSSVMNATSGDSAVGSAVDTPEGGFYATEEDGAVTEAEAIDNGIGAARPSTMYAPQADVNTFIPQVPGLQNSTASQGSNDCTSKNATSENSQVALAPTGNQPTTFKSLEEAKKEAQKAILRLWPLGVKFQHYIDEGFDETVIKSLFNALHLDIPTTRSKQSEPQQSGAQDSILKLPAQPVGTASKSPSAPGQPTAPADRSGETGKAPASADKAEERKDRIARLLAEKAAKPTPSQPSKTNPPSTTMESGKQPVPATKPKTREEKELLLQQKMEALKKSREARAQKAATQDQDSASSPKPTGTETSTTSASTSTSAPAVPQAEPESDRAAPAQPGTTAIPAASSTTPVQDGPVQEKSQAEAPIPGLSLPPTPHPVPSTHQRKRPVASDFIDYQSTAGSLKRPFGQAREDSSLVIDVSDGSDEEMDIDMDDESSTEPSAPPRHPDSSARRGPSIRDFPPLSDVSQRQYTSPVPPSHTPPGGFSNGKQRVTELDLKEKAIQEMRRKIAEAEAKRKAKKAVGGAQTPTIETATPSGLSGPQPPRPPLQRVMSTNDMEMSNSPSTQLISEAASAKLPKPSEIRLREEARVERRGRIASLDLPRLDGALREKMIKLKLLREQEAKLEAEIEQGLAEKNKLTDELDQLDKETRHNLPHASEQHIEGSSDVFATTASHVVPAELPPEPSSSIDMQTSTTTSDVNLAKATPCSTETSQTQSLSVVSDAHSPGGREHRDDAQPGKQDHAGPETHISAGTMAGPPVQSPPAEAATTLATPSASGVGAEEPASVDSDMSEPAGMDIHQEDAAAESDGYEPPGPMEQDTVDHATVSSSSPFSPAPAATSPTPDNNDDEPRNTAETSASQAQISVETLPREAAQEIETAIPSEVETVSEPKAEPTVGRYDSPLQYFRAYRFHPEYRSTVPGGLKSLTYSHRIDPNRELCPFELDGLPCPQGESCQFQHFRSVIVPDDRILLELGKADDYIGDQKTRFIQGLRELLQNFRANKIEDFETIATGIINFRSRFLGDTSKVLHLEGVVV